MSADTVDAAKTPKASPRKKFAFPGAVTTLALVTVVVWIAALFIPSGQYDRDPDGSPIIDSFHQVPSPLSFFEKVRELIESPINGVYGLQDSGSGFVNTEAVGWMFGSIGVILFIFALGAFISVSFSTRSLEMAVGRLAVGVGDRGWLLIVAVMALFSLLGSTMGFSVETFGFYGLLIPLFAALGFDRMVTASVIIIGALTGSMASTVNPFSIGVASGEAGVSIGDGIVLRVLLWLVLTTVAILFVLRYARRVQRDPSSSLVGFDITTGQDDAEPVPTHMSRLHKIVLAITGATFALMIFSVIPWSSIIGGATGGAESDTYHATAVEPYWFELNWWFPQLAMLFFLSAIIIGLVARMGEKRLVGLITQGIGDMVGPAIVIALARGVSVIMTNTQTLDTVLNGMENLVSGASAEIFAILVVIVNIPLAFLIPSSSGHATLALPLLAPLSDFAGVSRPLVITAYQMGHGLMLMFSPTNVVVVGGLAIAGVGYDKYLKFIAPLLGIFLVIIVVVVGVAAAVG